MVGGPPRAKKSCDICAIFLLTPTQPVIDSPRPRGMTERCRPEWSVLPVPPVGDRSESVDFVGVWKCGVISMWNFELQDAQGGTAVLMYEREAPCLVLRRGFDSHEERSAPPAADDMEAAASDSEGFAQELIRSSAGIDGVLRAGLIVPLGLRDNARTGLGLPEVISDNNWDEDDDVVDDDDDDDDEEDEDDDFFPDDADEFEDEDEDDEEEEDD